MGSVAVAPTPEARTTQQQVTPGRSDALGEEDVFRPETWTRALERYSAATHLTVEVTGLDGERKFRRLSPTPVYELLAAGPRDLGLFARCARRCLDETDAVPRVVVESRYGLAVVGTRLSLAGTTVGTAVAGSVVTEFPDRANTKRLALESGVPFDDLWAVLRRQLPLTPDRLRVYGELLQTLCDALVTETHHARQLEAASARLAAEGEAKDRFLAVLSHELRTPLTAMLGWARMLRLGKLGDVARAQALEAIERNTKLQAQLIEDLLHVSRIVAGRIELDLRHVNPAAVIEAVVETLRPTAEAKGVRLDTRLDAGVDFISADPARISQVVSNLVSNAIKFTPPGGRVEVRLTQGEREVQISVTDTGVGIAPEFMPHVFDRFRQADTAATRPHGGLGLGLTIVRHLVELHRGRVEVASRGIGRGATFTVRLPRLIGADARGSDDERAESADPARTLDDGPMLDGVRVLLVDDEPDARALFTSILTEHRAEVKAVASAADALRVLERWIPDVLVSDIGMPTESGYDLIRAMRCAPAERARIPALALTAYAGPEDVRLALEAGFQLHLAKPLEPAALVRAVAHLAGRE